MKQWNYVNIEYTRLCYWLGMWGRSECNKHRSTFNIENYCTIVSVVKYREIFQVYNNLIYLIPFHVHSFTPWLVQPLVLS